MNEPKTPNLGLNKIDRSSPSTTYFDLDKYLDQNWEKVDDFAEQVEEKVEETAAQVSGIQERLDTEKRRSVTLEPGLQIINAERASAFKLEGLKGRTLVNLLGRDGGFEGHSNWGIGAASATLDTTVYAKGSMSSLKVTLASTNSNISKAVSTSVGKTYVLVADVKNVSTSSAFVSISTVVNGNIVTGSKFGTSFARFTATSSIHAIAVVGGGVSGQVFNADNVRLYEVSAAEYAALNSMTPEQVAAKYPYVDSIQPVRNPYAIRYGDNLLPPFFENWQMTPRNDSTGRGTIVAPYNYLVVANEEESWIGSPWIPAVPGTAYTISAEHTGQIHLVFTDKNKIAINGSGYTAGQSVTSVAPANTAYVVAYFRNTRSSAGTYTFKNPMLTIGNTAKPFKPREDAVLALQTDLFADPLSGENADEVFEKNGRYFKVKKWQKVDFEGSRITSTILGNKAGFKTLYPKLEGANYGYSSIAATAAVKYDGRILTWGQHEANAEGWAIDKINSNFAISVSNSDSGWGDSYTPTIDEIKAYFMGWKMFLGGQGDVSKPYNGEIVGKAWCPLDSIYTSGDGTQSGSTYSTTLPIASITTLSYTQHGQWTPYQLVYQLAASNVEPITSEGVLTFTEDSNQVEVGTGIVLREGIKPVYYGSDLSYAYINRVNSNAPNSSLKHKVKKINRIYKDNQDHTAKWTIISDTTAYGIERATYGNIDPDYDRAGAYSVTYLMLDDFPKNTFIGSVADNEKALLVDFVKANGSLHGIDVGKTIASAAIQAETNAVNASLSRTGGLMTGRLIMQNWATFSSSTAGHALFASNCFLDGSTFRFENTHINIGARGIFMRFGSSGTDPQIFMFDTGLIATTAGAAFTPTLKRVLNQTDYDLLFQLVSDGKLAVAAAITGKGVASSGSDSFSQLATKIGQISTGPKYASGVVSAGGSSISFRDIGGISRNLPYVVVSGIGFRPNRIIVRPNTTQNSAYTMSVYNRATRDAGLNDFNMCSTGTINNSYSFTVIIYEMSGSVTYSNGYVNDTGFQLPVATTNTSYVWEAFQV